MTSTAAAIPGASVPLCVDLDGTLIKTDMLWESFVRLLKRNPLYGLLVPFWFMRGRAHLKAMIASRTDVDPANLPYNQLLLEFLRAEKKQGRPILLVTASDERLARSVAEHLHLFNEVLASDGKTNLRGKSKVSKLAARFGQGGFDYAGNSSVDIPVWQKAREALVVNAGPGLASRVRQFAKVAREFASPASRFRAILRALRPHQWIKNLIVFVPLLTSHRITQLALDLKAATAFVAFSLCASAVYLLNDLLDLDADRHHAAKRLRPLASGDLPLSAGLTAVPLLLLAGAAAACTLTSGLAAALACYLALSFAYSWRLKQLPLLDVFCLAAFYTIRLIAGQEATGVVLSFWLLVFSMFVFLSLALLKRFQELDAARQQSKGDIKGRGYAANDRELVAALGTVSGFLAVLVLALYVNSPEVRELYRQQNLLLLICPLLLYWISHVWLMAHRGQMHEDPIVFALRDRASYVVGALTLAVIWLATGH
jgi:4-hydroxybenzoate polyprenyltransferase/phosphoserine phosphatase